MTNNPIVPAEIQALVFDAYGTLFDVHSIVLSSRHRIAGDLDALSLLWRQKQLESTWLRTLMDRYEDFWHVTEEALRSAIRQLSIEMTEPQINMLMQAYLAPTTFVDVSPALEAFSDIPLAILSNGSPKMLDAAVRSNGLESNFTEIISVDRVKTYKPSPRAYALGPKILGIPAEEILFISSNSWDAAGAKAFGYKVCLCNRPGKETDCWGLAPDLVVSGLHQIAKRIQNLSQ